MPIAPREDQTAVPEVSIGMPVYNGERYIREALDSALRQTFGDFELIIADNGSNDATRDICCEYMACDSRIKYIRHEKNYGPTWNFSFVARHSKGLFFTWLAHDDVLEPQFLEQTVNYLSLNPQTVLVTGDFSCIDENGVELKTENLDILRDNLAWDKRRVPFFEYGNSNVHFSIYGMTRTEVCKLVMDKVREPYMADGSEYPILSRFAIAGEIASLPMVLRKYRVHSSSTYKSEVYETEKKHILIRNWHNFVKLLLLRLDFSRVLLGSSIPAIAKYRITQRHIIMGLNWLLYKTGKLFYNIIIVKNSES